MATIAKGALLSAAAAAVLCIAAVPATAQEAVIAACRALPTEAETSNCLADALRLATGQATLSADDLGVDASAQPAAPVVAAPAVAAPVPAAADLGAPPEPRRGFRLPFIGGGERVEAAPAHVASTSAAAAELGAQQVSASDAAPRVLATVVASEVVGYKQLQVELDNGQVWRQTQSDDRPWDEFDDDPTSVEIWEHRLGGYRMKLLDRDQTLAVTRVQ